MKPPRWNHQRILDEVSVIAKKLGRMPTNSDLKTLRRNDLSCAICKSIGFVALASEMGLARAPSESDTGWAGEKDVILALQEKGFDAIRLPGVKAPYDIMVDGILRIDVKTARFAEYGPCKGWFYRIGKYVPADVLILYQMDTRDMVILPWHCCPTTNVTISKGGGKYASFLNRFDIIKTLSEARTAETADTFLRAA